MRNIIDRSLLLVLAFLAAFAVATVSSASGKGALSGEPTRSYGSIDVILYVTSWCPYCNKARDLLRSLGVTIVEHDIEREPEKRFEMTAKSGSRGVPVLDVEGIILRGYSEEAIRQAIEQKRRE